MKNVLTIITFLLIAHLTNGQACGIYRINYSGRIVTQEKKIVQVYLPTTMFLHGLEKEQSEKSFLNTTLTKDLYDIEISSHLTTPYNNTTQILAFYRRQLKHFKLKTTYLEGGIIKETAINIDWNDIEVSIIEDGRFGTLFRFKIKDQFV